MFKGGQTVWCVLNGKGCVSEVGSHTEYPVFVKFENGNEYTYTIDGRYSEDFNRTLFFSEPIITAETEPLFQPTLKNGEKIFAVSENGASILYVVVIESKDYIDCYKFNTCSPIVKIKKSENNFYLVNPDKLIFN